MYSTALVRLVAERLTERYHDYAHGNKADPLAELVFIVCSVRTDVGNYERTYRNLRRRFQTAAALAAASPEAIAEAIAEGGLSSQKGTKIHAMLRGIVSHAGRPSLAFLRPLPDDECERFLLSLYGVGKKTARCVMMYSLGRQVFPVDTHCWRVSRRLGWVRRTRPDGSCSPSDMDRLQAKIPPDLRYGLHVNMISLGREVCTPQRPRCPVCPLVAVCPRIGVRPD